MSAGTGTDIKKFNSSSSIWGSITGNILNQLDLINYINTPRVINQDGGANIIINPAITDVYNINLDQNVNINYMANGVDGQIVLLQLYTNSGFNHTITVNAGYTIYDGVTVPANAVQTKLSTIVFLYSGASGVWYVYNASTTTA